MNTALKRKSHFAMLVTVLLASLILLQAVLPVAPAAAQEPATPTPSATLEPTATPTNAPTDAPTVTALPTEQPTQVPTATEAPTEEPTDTATASPTPTAEPIQLLLTATPDLLTPAGKVTLRWSITGLPQGEPLDGYLLVIHAPPGAAPADGTPGNFDPATATLTLTLDAPDGFIHWAFDAVGTVTFSGDLSLAGQLLDSESVSLEPNPGVEIGPAGGPVHGLNGRVQVDFPRGAVNSRVLVYVRGGERGPFQLDAFDKSSGAEVSHFNQALTIQVTYDEADVPGDEADLQLFYQDEDSGEWIALPSQVDVDTNLLYAVTDHFSLYNPDVQEWQAATLPSLDGFQVSNFTGAATYSMPLQLPPGPAGFEPQLGLSYNSQAVDNATSRTQASPVGMGWSLDGIAYIQRNMNGTNSNLSDDTWNLTMNGAGGLLLKGADGNYHTADETYAKISYDATNDRWIVYDKQGNIYYFEHKAVFGKLTYCGTETYPVWRYSLTKMQNIYNQTITYSYTTESKVVEMLNCNHVVRTLTITTAVYPDKITYPNGRYRVRFVTSGRNDYDASWGQQNGISIFFMRKKFSEIRMEQDIDANGTFETTMRKYALTLDASGLIFPNIAWGQGDRTLALTQVTEYGLGGTSSLPATTFTYGDHMHLTHAANGYGGTVHYAYDIWNDIDASDQEKENGWQDFGLSGQPCNGSSTGGWYQGHSGPSQIYCNDGRLFIGTEALNDDLAVNDPAHPGSFYKLAVTLRASKDTVNCSPDPSCPYGTWVELGIENVGEHYAAMHTGLHSGIAYPFADYLRLLPGWANIGGTHRMLVHSDGVALEDYLAVPVPTYSRVLTKTINDGNGHAYNTSYAYQGAASNDPSDRTRAGHSVGAATAYPYVGAYSEFRGHNQVTQTDPTGRVTVTVYHQDDLLKGRPISVTVYNGGQLASETTYTYASTSVPVAAGSLPYAYPAGDWGGAQATATDLSINFVYASEEITKTYDNAGAWQGSRTTYTYGSYGNLTQVQEFSGDSITPGWTLLRTTKTDYYPTDNATTYLVGLPGQQQVKDAGGQIRAETQYIYDHPVPYTYTAPPTTGVLTGYRTLLYCLSDNCSVSGNSRYSDVQYVVDAWGNRTSVITYSGEGSDTLIFTGTPATTTTAYDSTYHTYANKVTNALSQFTTIGNSSSRGLPISETDLNGVTTTVTYDDFGRITGVVRSDDANFALTMTYTDSYPFTTLATQRVDATKTSATQRRYDGLGRPIDVQTGSMAGSIFTAYNTVTSLYNSPNLQSISIPYGSEYNSTNAPYTTTALDALGRPLTVTAPDGTFTTYAYDGLTSTVTDAVGHSTTTTSDVWGQTVLVTPPAGPAVGYVYDSLGHLTKAMRAPLAEVQTCLNSPTSENCPASKTVSMSYDRAGRKLSMTDPDMGYWQYDYYATGTLKTQTDARMCQLTMTYDLLDRLSRQYSSGAGCGAQVDTSITYDFGMYGKGHRTGMTTISNGPSATWVYNSKGLVQSETRTISGHPYTTDWTYGAAGLPETMKYPDGETVTYSYDDQMLQTRLHTDNATPTNSADDFDYVSSTSYDTSHRMTSQKLGNGLTQDHVYNPWNIQGGRLVQIVAGVKDVGGGFTSPILNLGYEYDPVGNVTVITDYVNGQTQNFGYDLLNRLTSASATGSPSSGGYSETDSYDPDTGNLLTKGDSTQVGTEILGAHRYQYDLAHAHAVQQLVSAANPSIVENIYAYDPDGNMISRTVAGQTYTLGYDAEGHLTSVTSTNPALNASFVYDGDGARVQSTINGVTTTFVGNRYEVSGSTVTKYYFAGADRVAMRTNGTLNYLLPDHLGSTSITTDASGIKIAELRFKAWGEVRYNSGSTPTQYRYTGQYDYTPSFGLQYFNARWYDPHINHFTQPDTIVPDPYSSQDYDRYSYARNNSVRYNDPSGHDICDEEGYCYGRYGRYRNPYRREPLPSKFLYEGPIPDSLTQQLVQAGADPKLLQTVTLHIYDDPKAVSQDAGCGGSAAYTTGVDIYFCMPTYYKFYEPTPTLVHELVHVRQALEDPALDPKYFLVKIALTIISGGNPKIVHDKNPFEEEGMGCEQQVRDTQHLNLGLPPLNTSTCNLTFP